MIRKALSDVIAMVSLILIGIVVAAIVFAGVRGIIKQSLLSPQECADLQTQIIKPINAEDLCYNITNKELEVTLARASEEPEIRSIGFVVNFNDKSISWVCEENCDNCEILKQGIKKYYISLSEEKMPETLTLMINNCLLEKKEIREC